MNHVTDVATADSRWKSLYRVGGVAILLTLGLYLTELIGFAVMAKPFPTTMNEWFSLFQESKLLGLFYLNALDMISIALMGPMFLALYMALRQDNETWMIVGVFFVLIGIPVFIATRAPSLTVLTLSDQFAAATTEVQRTQILIVGDAVAQGQPTTQTVGFLFIAAAVLIISVIMLRGTIFGKITASVGILASVITFVGFISVIMVPSFAGALVVVSVVPWVLWWVLIARRLLQLGRRESKALPQQS